MLETCDLIAFAATSDIPTARSFYEGTLGLRMVRDDGFAVVFDAHGTTLRVTEVPEIAIAPYTTLGWLVTDIGATVEELTQRGVAFERYEGLALDGRGVWQAPGGDLVAWFKDPDGNTLSLTQRATGG